MRRLVLFAFLLPLALPATAAAPRPNIPTLGEVVDVSIVNVDVFVTDKQGHRVRGLTKDDFVITEDRKPQPITNFAEYGSDAPEGSASVEGGAATPAVSTAPAQKRTMILFVDRLQLNVTDRETFFGGLKTLLHNVVREGDSAMIVTWRNRLIIREPFTDDLERLDGTIDQLSKEAGLPFANEYVQSANEQSDYSAWMKEVEEMAAEHHTSVDTSGSRPGLDLQLLQALYEIRQKTAAINALTASISGVEGKKVLFLATHRLGEYAGAEYLLASGGNPATDVDFRSRYSAWEIIRTISKNANANGITVYPLYAEGLTSNAMARADLQGSPSSGFDYLVLNNELPTLDFLAKETGGLMAWGAQNIVKLLPSVQDDFDSYYSLAYRATTKNEDRSRGITVKTKNPGYVVRARRQFVEKSDDARMKDRVVANLFQDPGPSLIGVEIELGEPVHKKKDQFSIPVAVKIPVATLTTVPHAGKKAGAFSVYLTWGSHIGVTGEVVRKTQPFTIEEAEAAKAQQGVFKYNIDLLVDGRTTQLSVGVFDEVSREYGLARIDLPERTVKAAEAR